MVLALRQLTQYIGEGTSSQSDACCNSHSRFIALVDDGGIVIERGYRMDSEDTRLGALPRNAGDYGRPDNDAVRA